MGHMKRERRQPSRAERKRTARSGAGATGPPIEVYTDGGCRGNPSVGGWAALIYEGPKPKEIWEAQCLPAHPAPLSS
jgi:hypothetical protein